MIEPRYEVLPHTADKGIKAYGRDREELFENAALGMFSLMADISKYTCVDGFEIEVHASDTPELLRAWLAELVYNFEVQRMLFMDFEVLEMDDVHMKGIACGVPFDDVEWIGSPVKAVTHYELSIERKEDHLEATVIFDV
jgi:SHS2 domain-containing protein